MCVKFSLCNVEEQTEVNTIARTTSAHDILLVEQLLVRHRRDNNEVDIYTASSHLSTVY